MAKDAAKLTAEELQAAIELLKPLVPQAEIEALQPSSPNAVYTTLVTLWMLTLQRLGGGLSLEAVVKDVLTYNRDLLPANKRVRDETLSLSSAAYCGARQRLDRKTVEHFANAVSHSLIESCSPVFEARRTFMIDGTTITLAPTPDLQEAYPPATNQHGETVWPVAMLMVAHEMRSGCALTPEIGAMYGPNNTSEAKLAQAIAARIPLGSLVMADSGFGIFSVVYSVVHSGRPILFRLTKSRFKSLRRRATLCDECDGRRTYELHWTPSSKDRSSNPDLPDDAGVDVFLHSIPLEDGDELHLVGSLPMSSSVAAEHYSHRYDVEHDIRDIKVVMDTENIRAQTVEMMHKELLTSIVAYNLVVQFRRQAAAQANVAPRDLSFTRIWNTYQSFVLYREPCSTEQWQERFERALHLAAKYGKLPKRTKKRNPPRRAHPRRPKSTKFMKQQRNKNNNQPPPNDAN